MLELMERLIFYRQVPTMDMTMATQKPFAFEQASDTIAAISTPPGGAALALCG